MTQSERRLRRRGLLYLERRRHLRVRLEVDWCVESSGCVTFGRGIELSVKGAYLAIDRTVQLAEVVLRVALPGQVGFFCAHGAASARSGKRGWLIRFLAVKADDQRALCEALAGEAARKYARFHSGTLAPAPASISLARLG